MNRNLLIAYGNSCNAKFWSNKNTAWPQLCERLQTTIRTNETVEEYRKMKKSDKAAAKDKGGFVGGSLRDNRRTLQNVAARSMLTLDVDNAELGFIDRFCSACKYEAVLYTTHGHRPESPRVRLILPLSKDITAEMYSALARFFADEWGIEQFDECSYRPNQLMYWPTTPANGEYVFRRVEGEWLDPESYLAAHPDWIDPAMLPTSSRESRAASLNTAPAEDPLAKSGIVGAFNRTFYPISRCIDRFLSDVYEETSNPARYHFIESSSLPGVEVYDDKFVYSHHAKDPTYMRLCNAFDLVRIHMFGDGDGTFKQMCEFAAADDEVVETLRREKKEQAEQDFDSWDEALQYDKNGLLVNSLHNLTVIMENDDYMKNIVFNQLADGMEIKGEVPWKHPARYWRDADDAQLVCYIDSHYGTFSARNFSVAVAKACDDRSYHPIKNYLNSLPQWDGVMRVDSLLIDFLGAEDTDYIRAITRKTLCAAIYRVLKPGTKFDHILVLNGPQGIGKSTFISRLGGEWYSDSLSLYDMQDKTAAEKLQGYWIMEIGELAGMKKADIDRVKAFISRQDDKYRASFGRRVTPHPRQCVFFGTTNSEEGFLRDATGNRRFWVAKTPGTGKRKPWSLSSSEVQQIWAEVMVLVKNGEPLFLPAELEDYARAEQADAMEQDDREGLVIEYLNMPIPDTWDEMDTYQRRDYVRDTSDITRAKGTHQRESVSNIEIWCECFGRPKEDMKPSDSYAIKAMMMRFTDWDSNGRRTRIPIYGLQRIYEKKG